MSLQPLSVVDSTEYVHPHEIELAGMLQSISGNPKGGTSQRVSWLTDCDLPKALFLVAATKPPKGKDIDRALSPTRIFRKIIDSSLHKTHNIRINFIDPAKSSNELWEQLGKITSMETPELIIINAHGSPSSMRITDHPTQGKLSSDHNPFAKSVLSQLPVCDLVLSSCSTGKKNKKKNMKEFFLEYAPHVSVHAPENNINGFTWNELNRTIEWKHREKPNNETINRIKNLLISIRKPIRAGDTNEEIYQLANINKELSEIVNENVFTEFEHIRKFFPNEVTDQEILDKLYGEQSEIAKGNAFTEFNRIREFIMNGLTDKEILYPFTGVGGVSLPPATRIKLRD